MTKTYSKKELEELSAIKIVDRNLADKWNPKEDFQTDTAPALNKEIQTIIQTILTALPDKKSLPNSRSRKPKENCSTALALRSTNDNLSRKTTKTNCGKSMAA